MEVSFLFLKTMRNGIIEIIIEISIVLIGFLRFFDDIPKPTNFRKDLPHIGKNRFRSILICSLNIHKLEQSRRYKEKHDRKKEPQNHISNTTPSCFDFLFISFGKDKEKNRSKEGINTSSTNHKHDRTQSIKHNLLKTSVLINIWHKLVQILRNKEKIRNGFSQITIYQHFSVNSFFLSFQRISGKVHHWFLCKGALQLSLTSENLLLPKP